MSDESIWGDQVGIRRLRPGDAGLLARFMADPEVADLLFEEHAVPPVPAFAVAIALTFSWMAARPDYGILERATGRLIGAIRLWRMSDRNRSAMLTIYIGEKSCWGQGLGTQALRLVLDEAFGRLGLNRVELHVFDFNTRAIRSYEKVGFVREGARRQALRRQGQFQDIVVMGLLREEYLGARQADPVAAVEGEWRSTDTD